MYRPRRVPSLFPHDSTTLRRRSGASEAYDSDSDEDDNDGRDLPFTPISLTPRPPRTTSPTLRRVAVVHPSPPISSRRTPWPSHAFPPGLQSFVKPLSSTFVSRSSTLNSSTTTSSTAASFRTAKSTVSSMDSGHSSLIESINTTNKFTNKWPKPQPIRAFENRHGTGIALDSKAIAQALEEDRGMGVDLLLNRWTSFKWCLFVSVCTIFVYGTAGIVCAIQTWFRTWALADVMYVADRDILILITLAACILLFTALVGMTGTLLNSRPLLAVYTLLLWPAFFTILAIGYTSYKRVTFAFDSKLNYSWNDAYTPLGRLLLQDALGCCGYYNALHGATPSKRCYARSPLPGCKGRLLSFERDNLTTIWTMAFALVPLHVVNIMTALLCSNHITRTFGKGLTPRQYRLNRTDVLADAEKLRKMMAVGKPQLSRASSSGVFREDRQQRVY